MLFKETKDRTVLEIEFSVIPGNVNSEACGGIHGHMGNTVATKNFERLQTETVENRNGVYFVDAWQHEIVKYANPLHRGMGGNFPGDDMAKLRGLKYAVTGECESGLIRTISIGIMIPSIALNIFVE